MSDSQEPHADLVFRVAAHDPARNTTDLLPAIDTSWRRCLNEFKLDPARMWFTVFEGDAEVGPDEDAARFWEQVGAPRERIVTSRLPRSACARPEPARP